MVTPTCATCKWWTDVTSQYGDHLGDAFHPWIDGAPMPDRWGHCTKVDELGPQSVNTVFYVTDGSDYVATLHTRETFGCNQHEPATQDAVTPSSRVE